MAEGDIRGGVSRDFPLLAEHGIGYVDCGVSSGVQSRRP